MKISEAEERVGMLLQYADKQYAGMDMQSARLGVLTFVTNTLLRGVSTVKAEELFGHLFDEVRK